MLPCAPEADVGAVCGCGLRDEGYCFTRRCVVVSVAEEMTLPSKRRDNFICSLYLLDSPLPVSGDTWKRSIASFAISVLELFCGSLRDFEMPTHSEGGSHIVTKVSTSFRHISVRVLSVKLSSSNLAIRRWVAGPRKLRPYEFCIVRM